MSLPRLRNNIASLGALQMANYLIPLVTVPYLTRILGVESYGKMALVQVIMAYFALITDYGFSWSATRSIAANRDDHDYVSRIFSSTWCAQWLLASFALTALLTAIAFIPMLKRDAWLYLVGFTTVLGNVFAPLWLFQGLERMRDIAVIQTTARIVALPLLFIYVSGPTDVIYAVLVAGIGTMFAGLTSLFWIKRKHLVSWRKPTIHDVGNVLLRDSTLFLSRVSISFYTTLTPLALGIMVDTAAVGYFSLADKVRTLAQSMLDPVSQALFPRMSHLYENDRAAAQTLLKRSLAFVLLIAGCATTVLWFGADMIIMLLSGKDFGEAAKVLKVIAFLPLLVGLSNVFGVQVMLPNQHNRIFNIILGTAGILGLCIIWPLTYLNSAVGAAQSMLLVELFVTATMGIYLLRKGYLTNRPTN
ncbi:MAG: flippase [Methylococcaceae bacterium]|nr:flippase [Methylococcaceae bacterium]MDZ4156080.1 flippase [Methylococcales bacterium]MDP2395101.1 flippase [Methylococcaceae bacterium]MDP3018757.1 flippase [Methylococcaceae bacterium]MDP3390526.1 flippase [Methylococcaceae bacterium]